MNLTETLIGGSLFTYSMLSVICGFFVKNHGERLLFNANGNLGGYYIFTQIVNGIIVPLGVFLHGLDPQTFGDAIQPIYLALLVNLPWTVALAVGYIIIPLISVFELWSMPIRFLRNLFRKMYGKDEFMFEPFWD